MLEGMAASDVVFKRLLFLKDGTPRKLLLWFPRIPCVPAKRSDLLGIICDCLISLTHLLDTVS